MRIKALIIEDEVIAARNLKRMIRSVSDTIEIVGECESVEESIEWLKENIPDLIFQDIQLADGNSFQIFEEVEVETPIIFTTAFDEYAIAAFKQNSVDYLLKPIDEGDLRSAIDKFQKQYFERKGAGIDYAQLSAMLRPQDFRKRFLIKIGSKFKTVNIEDVAYFFVDNKVCHIRTKENRSYPLDISMTQLATKVDPTDFFRINRQLLVSATAIESLQYLSSTRVRVNLNPTYENAIVAIEKIVPFKKWLDR
ncbi:MAG: LytTR family DNA-binding domain-containing protein [Bacteroidia bacterium]|nr:LytTR family DNA-binding domain-containing protein [Bacteroidia bacterium]